MEKVKIYAIYEDDEDMYNAEILVEDLLRQASQFNLFEDLIGRTIEHVEYEGDEVILTIK